MAARNIAVSACSKELATSTWMLTGMMLALRILTGGKLSFAQNGMRRHLVSVHF
ncbi:hypothetical protein HNQ36_000339 [Afipia massiliensis]|uniref:Uncharacterized protein n=1 Tax=Afipia massiliensis TaxID=211460 RepID=A0A840MXK8_9BRAD|nr:hypothetical protein [Afipia massiliensis]MBB5050391.1 hypothetical protein [Afipia massiliensis]